MRSWLYILAICATLGVQAHAWAHSSGADDASLTHGEICLACKLGQNNIAPTVAYDSGIVTFEPLQWRPALCAGAPKPLRITVYQSRAPPLNTSAL